MSKFVCFKCGRGPLVDGTSVYRQNEKGVDPIMACAEHSTVAIDPDVLEITTLLESDGKPKQ